MPLGYMLHSAKGVMGCAFVLAFQVLSLPLRDLSLEIPKELKSHIKMGQHFTITDVPQDKSQYVMEVFNDEKDLFCIYDPKKNEVHVYKGMLTD
jgi:hypothetical protein